METALNDFSEVGFLRLPDVLRIIPVSRSAWWAWIKEGIFPKAVKMTPKCSAWTKRDIFALAKRIEDGSNSIITQEDKASMAQTTH